MMKIKIDPATRREMVEIAMSNNKIPVEKVMSAKDIIEIQELIEKEVHIDKELIEKAAGIAELTWPQNSELAKGVFKSGVSNRGPKYLKRAAQALAAIEGRSNVLERDIAELLYPVYWHTVVFEEYEREKYETIFDDTMRKIILKVFPELLEENIYNATR